MNNEEKATQMRQEQRWKEWVKKKIGFYISTGKWDNLSVAQLSAWLANFDEEGQKWALALLNNFIYYPDRDVKRLCQYAIMKVVFRDKLLNIDQSHDFCCPDEVLLKELSARIQETKIVPVLKEGNPTESGNNIARIYTATGLIKEDQVIRPDDIISNINQGACKRLLFVDDFLGSGKQLDSFWNEKHRWLRIKNQTLAQICRQHPNISFEYVALVATSQGLKNIEGRVTGLKIAFCEKLSDEYQVFGNDSIFFETLEDRKACQNYLQKLCRQKKIRVMGYRGLDFAIAFHHGAPNSCLPLFWDESTTWSPLFERRM